MLGGEGADILTGSGSYAGQGTGGGLEGFAGSTMPIPALDGADLLEGEADHYLGEIARVLAPGGRVLVTFFLLDDSSRQAITEHRAGLPFLDPHEPVALVSDEVPEEAVAYDRGWVDAALARHGLTPLSGHPGTWRGGDDGRSFQDIVVARRG